ncbi:MAG: hypothetical protein R3F43_12840 [bacterium]
MRTLTVRPGLRPGRGGWRLYAEALTEVPLQVGVRVVAETPRRVRFRTSVGYLPACTSTPSTACSSPPTSTASRPRSSSDRPERQPALEDPYGLAARGGSRQLRRGRYTLLGLGGGVSGEDALIAGAELPAVGGAESPRTPSARPPTSSASRRATCSSWRAASPCGPAWASPSPWTPTSRWRPEAAWPAAAPSSADQGLPRR